MARRWHPAVRKQSARSPAETVRRQRRPTAGSAHNRRSDCILRLSPTTTDDGREHRFRSAPTSELGASARVSALRCPSMAPVRLEARPPHRAPVPAVPGVGWRAGTGGHRVGCDGPPRRHPRGIVDVDRGCLPGPMGGRVHQGPPGSGLTGGIPAAPGVWGGWSWAAPAHRPRTRQRDHRRPGWQWLEWAVVPHGTCMYGSRDTSSGVAGVVQGSGGSTGGSAGGSTGGADQGSRGLGLRTTARVVAGAATRSGHPTDGFPHDGIGQPREDDRGSDEGQGPRVEANVARC